MVSLGLVAAAAWSSPALAPVVPRVSDALGVARRLPPGNRGVALTFDDGPHPEGTPAVLEILSGAGVHATFFLVGEQVERLPELALRIASEGHVVGLHGYRHRNQLRVPPAALAKDLDRGAAVIAELAGAWPTLYRPPYGIFSPAGLAIVRRRGWAPLLWSRWGHDWRRFTTPERIAAELTHELVAGDVLLMHDADHYTAAGSWRRTVDAMPRVLEALDRLELPAVTPQPVASR